MGLGIALGLGALGTGVFGAINSSNALSQLQSQEQAQQALQAQLLQGQQSALQSLYANQVPPAQTYADILGEMPGLLATAVPALEPTAAQAARWGTSANVNTYEEAMNALYPGFNQEQANQLKTIESMNPDNTGTAELQAISRQASPLIPAGTLGPTGAVQGGTTDPASLYRNLISGNYEAKRTDYLNAVGGYINNAENSALRQQVQAPSFLNEFLNSSTSAAQNLTGQTTQQNESNIAAQTSLLQSVLGMNVQPINSAPYISAATSGISSGLSGLTGALALSGNLGGAGGLGGLQNSLALTPTTNSILGSQSAAGSFAAQPNT